MNERMNKNQGISNYEVHVLNDILYILRCKLEQSDCFLEKVLIEIKALGQCGPKEMKKKNY